uniref:Uncharacterized protein n=1 Tax=Lepeophtheirus salmonis TaxID=72036 RepID=A0A0K2VCC7_LEPSM
MDCLWFFTCNKNIEIIK